MKLITRRLAMVALVGAFVLLWSAQTEQDAVVAQTGTSVMVTRIYTGQDGLSHAEEIEMEMTTRGVSDMIDATGVQFSSRAPGPASDWHTGPRRQFVITLSGSGYVEVSGGKRVAVGPGQINLIEDTTGKGHITRNLGPDNRIVVTIPLADQAGPGGGR
jgi:hypothetical protein